MKTPKLIMACMAIVLCTNFLFAGNPKNDATDNLATLLIEKLGKDIVLTDSQKVKVKQNLKVYIVKMQNAHALSNNSEKFTLKKQAGTDYQTSLDSLLTSDQKDQLNAKIKERENAK